jgi:hypothetical protein
MGKRERKGEGRKGKEEDAKKGRRQEERKQGNSYLLST